MVAFIADFGKNEEGLNLFRINGKQDEIRKAIEEIEKTGCIVFNEAVFEKSYKEYSVLIKIKIPVAKNMKKAK